MRVHIYAFLCILSFFGGAVTMCAGLVDELEPKLTYPYYTPKSRRPLQATCERAEFLVRECAR